MEDGFPLQQDDHTAQPGRLAVSLVKKLPASATSVAVIHDYLTQRGGAERVVLSMLKAFPTAQIHTSLYNPEGTFPEFERASVHTTVLDRWSVLRKNHRLALPFLASSFGRHQVDADVVICSSSGWAHGAVVPGRKIVYCYSPARWLYDGHSYLGQHHRVVAGVAGAIRPALVRWDKRAAATADRYLTLSTGVQKRIRSLYGIEAEVLYPPPTLRVGDPRTAADGVDPGFFLCVSRLLPYKNVDAVVRAFAQLPTERLIVVGSGPERRRLEAIGGPNVTFVGSVPDAELRWLYAASRAVVAASYEDYGLTPLEGATFGKPAVVLRKGGFLETVVDRETGVFFDEPDPLQIATAVRLAARAEWAPSHIHEHVHTFGEDRFIQRLVEVAREEATR